MSSPAFVSEKNNAALLWSIAELLRGYYKASEYGRVILPLVVLRRLAAVADPHSEEVQAAYADLGSPPLSDLEDWQMEELKAATSDPENINPNHFFNISPFTLQSILDTSSNTLENLEAYIEAFSPNVRQIFSSYRFNRILEELNEHGLLYKVLARIVAADLSPEHVSNTEMGLVFEELIRKFSEDSAADNGEFFTPRDNISLAVQLAFAADEDDLAEAGSPSRSVYDCTAGTGGMLSVSEEYLKSNVNSNIELNLFGQELNAESYAICLSDMILKGQPVENIRLGNTLSDDKHADRPSFDYILANPPYGTDWTNVESQVREEFARSGENGRFVGLPRKSDGQLLFLSHIASKLRKPEDNKEGLGGRAAVVHNGSSLFSGNAGSGESVIRQWLFEKDYVDAIVAIPTSMFYSTGIATFMWVLDTNKDENRKGKVALIDATACWSKMRKNLGQKSRYMSAEDIDDVMSHYHHFLTTGSAIDVQSSDPTGAPQTSVTQVDVEPEKELSALEVMKRDVEEENKQGNKEFSLDGLGDVLSSMTQALKDPSDALQGPSEALGEVEAVSEPDFPERLSKVKTKVFDSTDFGYRAITLEHPLRAFFIVDVEADNKLISTPAWNKLSEQRRDVLAEVMEDCESIVAGDLQEFKATMKKFMKPDAKLKATEWKLITDACMNKREDTVVSCDDKGNIIPDPELREEESVPLSKDLEEYLEEERKSSGESQLWIDESKTKIGYEVLFNRYFYEKPKTRSLEEIDKELEEKMAHIIELLKG